MFFRWTGAYLGVVLSTLFTAAGEESVLRAENVRWLSFNFKTVLTWDPKPVNYTYTVYYSQIGEDWMISPDCIHASETECDLTNHLIPMDRNYSADIKSEAFTGMTFDLEELPHTLSQRFNPYRESNISAVVFRVEMGEDNSRVTLHIIDPLTPLYRPPNPHPNKPPQRPGRPLNIRDVLQQDLKYKISYYKAGRTGKKEVISNSSITEISELEPGGSYCFNVRAFIPSRPKHSQLGAWSQRQCTPAGNKSLLHEWSVGALLGGCFLLLTLIIVIIIVSALCWRHRRRTDTKATQLPPTA